MPFFVVEPFVYFRMFVFNRTVITWGFGTLGLEQSGLGNVNFAIKSHKWLIHLERWSNRLLTTSDVWWPLNQSKSTETFLAQKYTVITRIGAGSRAAGRSENPKGGGCKY